MESIHGKGFPASEGQWSYSHTCGQQLAIVAPFNGFGTYPVSSSHTQLTPRDVLAKWDAYAEVSFGEKYVCAVHDYLDRFWIHLMDLPVLQITQEQVHEVHVVIKGQGWSPESVNKALNAFSCLATFAVEELGWFPYVPFRFHRASTEGRRNGKFLRKHQIVPFLRVIASFDHLHILMLVALMIGLALREVEALWACWSKFSYDDEGGLVFTTLGKNGKERQIPVPDWLEIMIRRYEDIVMDPEYRRPRRYGRPRGGGSTPLRPAPTGTQSAPQTDWMFPNGHGKPYSQGFTGTYIRRACKVLGIIGVTSHRLRATGANVLKLEGLSVDEIQKLLGHSRITTTMLYLEQSLTATREVQNTLGAKLWPGVPSAVQDLRQKLASDTRVRLLPPPKEVTTRIGEELALDDTPTMRLLPPDAPVEPVPPEEVEPTEEDERRSLLAGIQELAIRPKPSRPSRSQLERLVWLVPTSTLAGIFGVSDVTVANWCDEDGIQKPGRGFWAKSQAAMASLRKASGQS